jgi:hypothetical protein
MMAFDRVLDEPCVILGWIRMDVSEYGVMERRLVYICTYPSQFIP